MAKGARKSSFHQPIERKLEMKLVKCYIWSIALFGDETWTLREVDQKYVESFEMWCWRRMEISWTDRERIEVQWKPLIMITLGPVLFDNNNWLITLSGGYKNLHYLTQFIITTFYMYKKQQNLFKKLM